MEKVSVGPTNLFCPQALYMYGTYREDGAPNFGLFTWLSYCWDGELGIMASIGGGKLTLDRIHAGGVFSANLVTRPLLPYADYVGNNPGRDTPGKMNIPLAIGRGAVLPVPVLEDSPWVFELEVSRTVPLEDNEVLLCKIRNVLADKALLDESVSVEERLRGVAPVVWVGKGPYLSVDPMPLGLAGDWTRLDR